MTLAQLLGTCCGTGYLRPAPGTWGSLMALPVTYALHSIGGFPLLAAFTLAAIFAGLWYLCCNGGTSILYISRV